MPRLSKVTKELNVGLQTCVDFLLKKGHTVENSLNAKINDEQYELLVLQFSQDKDVRLKAEQAQRERINSKMEAKTVVAVEEPKKEDPKKETPVVEEKPAVSFKVVGKIDLDAPKSEPKVEEELAAPIVEEKPSPVVEEPVVVEEPKVVVEEEKPAAPVVEEKP
ncbi:MAG: translation initiation factor IF-2, partial [Bacteroidaceae bacterium]|nr:translation initiation factor IF-2 [Bacteroidaceae bacterium]